MLDYLSTVSSLHEQTVIDSVVNDVFTKHTFTSHIPSIQDVKNIAKEELDNMGGVKNMGSHCLWLMYTRNDLYDNVIRRLYWVLQIQK